ncbi:PilN domain-containing protein [Legionella londiniensis]|uniref:Tfp pilus assembly protein PilN n=1 Tax=Legionella londiniensis TaxID=45068 RepID=A0A0W0VQV7_9GAMM|nr:PilN domain-containing protein [Legionella londiniensis]KTD22426.1 Tfp pilus assembly protein PilN [Legionella londiniensis]STX93001.1 type IV pilus assembly protein PilN [Legionella londiniensis]
MTEINLLPWRELRREREKKEFNLYLFLGLITAALIVFLINFYANQLIENQMHRNQLLENEIARLDKQIKEIEGIKALRQALIARMTIIQNLQATRSLTPRLFDELVKIIPNGVYLTKVERKEDTITLLGYAESNSNISQLMRNIERNQWIQNPDLTEIKKTKEAERQVENEFKLSFNLREVKT